VTSCASRTVGLFVPKPARDADYQVCGMSDREVLSVDIRWRPLLPVLIVTHLVTRPLESMKGSVAGSRAHCDEWVRSAC
jgi:hypothetical protein